MLQKQSFQEQLPDEGDGQFLSPAYLRDVLKRRSIYFLIPFVVILTLGTLVTVLWPATYISKGTILVESQEIPSNLVQPTVAAATNERIQSIEQRIMTRDNLLAIAKKFQMFPGWRQWLSGTEIVDFIRTRKIIKPTDFKLANEEGHGRVLAFTVGFEHERPETAMQVANELITMILKEDVRTRTNFATETTKFLEQEVKKNEADIAAVDKQISELKNQQAASSAPEAVSAERALVVLKEQLILKQASLSDSHPEVRALKQKIQALEKIAAKEKQASLGIDALESKRTGLKADLVTISQKLATARIGENLERGQHSERLEVIEQPTLPQIPVSPNRAKLFGLSFALALMAGGGLVFALEMFDKTIRSSGDLYKIVDRHLVVAIPYISTNAEVRRNKNMKKLAIGLSAVAVVGGLTAAIFLLPFDIAMDKIMAHLRL